MRRRVLAAVVLRSRSAPLNLLIRTTGARPQIDVLELTFAAETRCVQGDRAFSDVARGHRGSEHLSDIIAG